MISRARFGIAVFAVFVFAAPLAAGPVSQYFLTAGDQSTNWVVQDAAVVTSWAQRTQEYPLAVGTTVRAIGSIPGASGTEYTLAGVQTGVTYVSGLATGNMYDGASDGTYNYGVNWGDGDVIRFDLDWSNPVTLFSLGAATSYLGITYDPTNNSLWIASWNTATIYNYTMGGVLISSFTTPAAAISCLALDPADNTLWFGSQSTQGTFYQYSKAGVQLSTETYATLVSQNTLGGEFSSEPLILIQDIPTLDPIGIAVLAILLAGAGFAIISRMRLT